LSPSRAAQRKAAARSVRAATCEAPRPFEAAGAAPARRAGGVERAGLVVVALAAGFELAMGCSFS
jgi:hypothetical protein